MRIRDIAMSRPRFGYERIHVLLRREGWHVNLKRVHKVVLSGRSSSAHAGTPKEAYEPAPWAGTDAHGARTALEHGFCARSTGQWATIPGSDGRR